MKSGKFIRVLIGIGAFVALLAMQILLGKVGTLVSSIIPFENIDPDRSFMGISIHHAVELILSLGIVLFFTKVFHRDFHFQLGDRKAGMKSLLWFMAVMAALALGQHAMMYLNGQLPVYDFPLDARNVLGTLGFQLLLSGPMEEILFRAVTIVLLMGAFGKSEKNKGGVALVLILSSLMFAFAHVSWSLSPLTFRFDLFGVVYAFAMGMVQGLVYLKTKSILYPILMHSLSNVLMVGVGYLFTFILG